MNAVMSAYKAVFAVLKKKPVILVGLTILYSLIVFLISLFGFAVPIITVPVILTFEACLNVIFLKGLREEKVDSNDLFAGFKNFAHVAGGMAWMCLWIFIWSLVPIVGPVLAIIKSYSYRFTPYILMTRPEISALDALKESIEATKSLKGKMFVAEILPMVAMFLAGFIVGVFSSIPFIGVLFALILMVLTIAFGLLYPVFNGMVIAYFYDSRKMLATVSVPAYTLESPEQES